jgi:hypothetical protein
VFESNFRWGRETVCWQRFLFSFALIAVPAILSSCGSKTSATTTTPTITVSCNPVDVTVLSTSQCTATVLNLSSTLVNWSVGGTGTGSIASGGLYTAPGTVPTNNVVTITATSQVQSTLTATQNLTIVQPTAIAAVTCNDPSGNPATTVVSGNTLACTATTSTGGSVPVNWSVANTNHPGVTLNIGSVSAQGIYTAPLVPPPGQSVIITATSQALATQTMSVTAKVVFGNAVLSGPYVFSTSGRTTTKVFWARVGSFSAGGGAILNGLEDTNQGGSPNTVQTLRTFSGSYSIGPDGRGTMQFCDGTPAPASCPSGSLSATAFFSIVVVSPQQVQIIEFSLPGKTATTTAGGEMISQDPSVPGAGDGNLSGTYSFNFAGVSTSATEHSILGEFAANGHTTISGGTSSTPGEIDVDPVPGGSATTLPATTYSISANGRGTVTLNGLNFSFYPVSDNRSKFIEIDTASSLTPTTPASILVGDAFKQQTSLTCNWGPTALSGPMVFETSGLNTTGGSPGVLIADVGDFTASGTSGTFSGASIDENSGGSVPPPQIGTLSGNYVVGTPCGRGTLSVGSHTYVFYLISTSNAVLQETTAGINAHGLLVPSQGGPFADPTLTGSYAFRLGGTDAAGTVGQREDFLGQFTSSGSGTGVAGALDLNDLGTTQTGLAIANGMYSATGGLRATIMLPVATSPSTTRNFVLYMISPTLFYALDTDPSPAGTAIGVIDNQF